MFSDIFSSVGDFLKPVTDFTSQIIDYTDNGLELFGYDVYTPSTGDAGSKVFGYDFYTPSGEAVKTGTDAAKAGSTLFGYQTSDIMGIAKAAAYGIGGAQAQADKREQAAEGGLNNVQFQSTSTNFDPRLANFGAPNYAGSAANVERFWQQVLTTFISPEQTKGKNV